VKGQTDSCDRLAGTWNLVILCVSGDKSARLWGWVIGKVLMAIDVSAISGCRFSYGIPCMVHSQKLLVTSRLCPLGYTLVHVSKISVER